MTISTFCKWLLCICHKLDVCSLVRQNCYGCKCNTFQLKDHSSNFILRTNLCGLNMGGVELEMSRVESNA